MICFDTEDDSQGNVKIINFFDGNKHSTFVGDNCRYKSWSHLYKIAPAQVWAVNAEYDLVNLFGPWLGKLTTLQYVSSGLMRAIWREGKVTFYDTMRHWAASVESMGKTIGLPKLSMPHLGCTCDDCVEYCKRDTEITWRFVDEMLSRYEAIGLDKVRSTLPSMALQLFKQFYVSEFPELPEYHRDFFHRGYYGGRVEVYKMGLISGVINHYDVNSLFPSVMRDYTYPDLTSGYVTDKPDFEKDGMFEGWVYQPKSDYPCLPVRHNEILFPYGSLYGIWPYPEIRQLLQDGGKVIRCKEAIEFDATESPFINYVNFCYGKRLEATEELDKIFWKLMLNSLYGKFGQSKGLHIIFDDEEKILEGVAKHANVIWSAYVTSYARLRLLSFLRSSKTCFYTDTDSLFTFDELDTSPSLGQLKLEGTYSHVEFKGNKLYCLDDKPKAKGVPRNVAGDFFKTGEAKFRKPMRFKESRVRGLQANVWNEVVKKNRMRYTKRYIKEDLSTEPWNFADYIEFKKRENLE